MRSLRWMISYIFVALVGLWMAFAASAKLMASARAQEVSEAPVPGSAPAEEVPQAIPPPPASDEELPDSTSAVGQSENTQLPATEKSIPSSPQDAVAGGGVLSGQDYFYDPTGKRDPFKPVGLKALGLSKPVILEPLQRFELDKLQVIGILWDVQSPRAMIKDPDGIMHTVVKNTKIGRSEGFVAAIREGELVIVETLYEEGKAVKQTRVMELKKGTKAL